MMMKNIKKLIPLIVLAFIGIAISCKKDKTTFSKGITAYKFVVKDALGTAVKEYPGIVSENEIVVDLPIEVDITDLIATFSVDNERTIVSVGNTVQESGITEQDFTTPINYTVKAEDRSTKSYTVRVEKKTALKSFGFYKEDNPDLTTDYIGLIKGFNVNIGVSETVNLTKLVARFETTTGAILKVNNVLQESKKSINDFSNPVDYTFTVANLPNPLTYKVNISFSGRQWTLMAEDLTGKTTASGIKLGINPLNNYPYFIYQRTGKDDKDVAIPTDGRSVAVIGYNGNTFNNIGPKEGISEFRADVPGIAFSADGTLYVAYKDYLNAEQKATMLRYNGTSWTVFGTSRFTPLKIDYLSLVFDKNDDPLLGMMRTSVADAVNNPPVLPRGLYVTNYNAGWNNITPPGSKIVASQQTIKGLDNLIYVGAMDRTGGTNRLSMFKYENGSWSNVGPTAFLAPDGLVGFVSVSIAVDKNGEAYLAYQAAPSSGRINHVMKYNKKDNVWQEIGIPTPSGGVSDNFAIAVDANNQLYFAYANASSLVVKTLNSVTNNWNTERRVIREKVGNFDMQVAADGTVYIVASLSASSKTVVYKYGN